MATDRSDAQTLLDNVHDAVFWTDTGGIIRSWNASASRIYGWSASEAIGHHVRILWFEEDLPRLESEVLAPLRWKDTHEVTVRNRHASGREIFVALRLSVLRDESGAVVGVIRCSNDITEQRRTEADLRAARRDADASLSLLTTLFRTAPVGLGFVDRDLRYVRVNDALAEINGIPASEHLGRAVPEVVPDLASTLEPVYRSVIDTRVPVVGLEVSGETAARPGERRHWLANYYPVEGRDGTVLGVGIVIIEDTERRRAQEAIRRERDFSEGVIRTARAIVLVLDPQGRIVRFNPFMERLSGYRLEEVRGRDWFETFLPQRDHERIRNLFQTALERKTRGNINPIVTRDGSERQISWWDTTLTDPEGNVQGVLAIGHDITDLLEAQRRALRTERLAAVGQTITTVAHEARSELFNLGMGLMLLERAGSASPEQAQTIELLREGHARLHRLFDELRSFAAPVELQRADCDLREPLHRAWESLAPQREGRDASLDVRLAPPDSLCPADAVRMEQVFRNLLENALASCPDRVRIEVRGSEVTVDGRPHLRLAVRDDGPGLSEEDKEHLFEPFFSTRPEGLGLGLAIVRRIVEAHGGSIAVGDARGRGAEFVLVLPKAPGALAA